MWWKVIIGGLALAVTLSGGLLLGTRLPSADRRPPQSSASGLDQLEQPPLALEPELSADPIDVRALAAVVLDASSGRLLVAKDAHRRVPIASTTKVLSAIVLLESQPKLDTLVTVSPAAASQIGSVMGLGAGEQLSVRGLLEGALLVSGNDAAYALAEHTGGIDRFVSRMNETARELGLTDSTFYDPAGLEDRGTSSAFDLAQMLRFALTLDVFRSIITLPEAHVTSSTDSYQLENSNRLVRGDEPLYFPDAIGGKTGFTPDAGHVLVAAARRDGHVLIAAVLASDDTAPDGSAREARRLLSWTFDHTRWQ